MDRSHGSIEYQAMRVRDEIEYTLLHPTIYKTRLRLMEGLQGTSWKNNFFVEHPNAFYFLLMTLQVQGRVSIALGQDVYLHEHYEESECEPMIWDDVDLYADDPRRTKRLVFDERIIAMEINFGGVYPDGIRRAIEDRHTIEEKLRRTIP